MFNQKTCISTKPVFIFRNNLPDADVNLDVINRRVISVQKGNQMNIIVRVNLA